MKPIFIELPEQIESERLIMRWPRPGTGPAINEAIRESVDDLKPWMPWAQVLPSIEDSEERVRLGQANVLMRSDFTLHLFHKTTSVLVGCAGLHPKDWAVPKFEIGYWCRTSCQGQGFITEAVRALGDFAVATLAARRIEIRCDQRNLRSSRVAVRAGYHLEATFPHDCLAVDGQTRTTLVYART